MNQKAFTVDEYHDSLGQTERPIFDVSVSGFIVPAHPELGAFQRSYKDAVCALAKCRGISLSDIQTSSTIKVVVACRNASGSSDMPVFDVAATQDQIDLGEHYDLAEKMASEAGYEAPFVCFDPQEVPALKRALEAYGNHAEKAHDDVTPGM